MSSILKFAVLCVLLACASKGPLGPLAEDDSPAPAQDAGSPGDGPTFYEHIAPLFAQHCRGCHGEGGMAPFELTTYEQVTPFGPAIVRATRERTMPPFLPDNSGACATYRDAQWLSDEQIALIARWVDDGMVRGDSTLGLLPAPSTTLAEANNEAWMTETYTPDDSAHDDYRCFLFEHDLEGSAPRYVTDYIVVPGDTRVVHHVIVFQPLTAAGETEARDLDAEDAIPGYECFGGAGVSQAAMLMNWAPGGGPTRHPPGTGVALDPTLPLIVQIHYNTHGGTFPDLTRIRMRTEPEVRHPMRPWFFMNPVMVLPPGKTSVEHRTELQASHYSLLRGALGLTGLFDNGPLTIMGIRAHMHQLGRAMHVTRDTDAGHSDCLVDVPRYDFGWQKSYFLERPVTLAPEDQLISTCVFDTSERTENTAFGEGTEDEMCIATLYTIEGPYLGELP